MSPLSVIETVRVAVPIVGALALLAALLRYEQQVLHRSALALLVATMVGLAASLALQTVRGQTVLAKGLQTVVAATFVGVAWVFAADFLDFGDGKDDPVPAEVTLDTEGGGFADAERE